MPVKAQVQQLLANANGPLCDDCLAEAIGASQRQTAYQLCSQLAAAGRIGRGRNRCARCGKVKNASWGTGSTVTEGAQTVAHRESAPAAGRPWFWEGNVQAQIVSELARNGFQIRRVADTESHEPGRDIEAVGPDGRGLWISVKGFPEKSASVQARHWFAGAVFDLLLYRDENSMVELALGLPKGFSTYENLTTRVKWARPQLPFVIYWVDEQGSVTVER